MADTVGSLPIYRDDPVTTESKDEIRDLNIISDNTLAPTLIPWKGRKKEDEGIV